MRNLGMILRFGWPYLRRYQARLLLGLGLGVLFGLSGALILGASNILLERLDPRKPPIEGKEALPAAASVGQVPLQDRLREVSSRVKQQLQESIDPWLPRIKAGTSSPQTTSGLV